MKSLINSAYKLTAVSGILAVAFFAFVGSVNAATVTSSDLGVNGWFFYNDETDVIDNTLGSFVIGPGTTPLGSGSVQISVMGSQRRNLTTYQFAGIPFSSITDLKFSTYNSSAGNPGSINRSGYLQFNVSFDGNDTWQRRLVFLPSQNGTIVQNSWQEWDAINGGAAMWGYSGSVWPTTAVGPHATLSQPGTTLRSWNDIKLDYPNIGIRATDAFFGIRVGEPYPDGYTENIDKITFNGNTFDFELLGVGQTAPDVNGTVTVTDTNKDVVVASSTQPLTIEVGDITDATIDFDSLITGGTGDIPQTTINSDVVDVEIPATTITSTDTNWDGTINLPKIITTTVEPTPEPGKTATVGSSIEVGYGEMHLTFDLPVKLTFAGQANSLIGWSQNGAFHEITSTCDSETAPTLTADSECKVVVGSDLVVWTKHFTIFTTYTQASVSVARSGGRSGNRVSPALPSQASPVAVGRVLGAFTGPEGTNLDSPAVVAIKAQIAGLIAQLIGLLREQLATAIAAGLR